MLQDSSWALPCTDVRQKELSCTFATVAFMDTLYTSEGLVSRLRGAALPSTREAPDRPADCLQKGLVTTRTLGHGEHAKVGPSRTLGPSELLAFAKSRTLGPRLGP